MRGSVRLVDLGITNFQSSKLEEIAWWDQIDLKAYAKLKLLSYGR